MYVIAYKWENSLHKCSREFSGLQILRNAPRTHFQPSPTSCQLSFYHFLLNQVLLIIWSVLMYIGQLYYETEWVLGSNLDISVVSSIIWELDDLWSFWFINCVNHSEDDWHLIGIMTKSCSLPNVLWLRFKNLLSNRVSGIHFFSWKLNVKNVMSWRGFSVSIKLSWPGLHMY